METVAIQGRRIWVEFLILFAGSSFLALLSQIAIPLPMTPVPMTLQTLGVFLLAGVLGSRRGTYCVIAYLIQGTCGLPVFAGGISNPLWFIEPKAGFLISFVVVAFLIGKLIEKKHNVLFSIALGQLLIFLIGMCWLALYVGFSKAFAFGVVPFLSGAGVKVCVSTLLIKGYHDLRHLG